jgi:hypothetical protein
MKNKMKTAHNIAFKQTRNKPVTFSIPGVIARAEASADR